MVIVSATRSGPLRDAVPVFVIGAPRSGTTMLGAMLGSHSRGLAVPESDFFVKFAPDDPSAPVVLSDVVDAWRRRGCLKEYDIAADRRPDGVGTYADAMRWIVLEQAAALGRPEPAFWIDHGPANTLYVPEILSHFPAARFVHLVRDGRAVAASVLPLPWGPMTVLEAGWMWSKFVAFGCAAANLVDADSFVETRYEALVAEPERELRRIMGMIGFAYEPAMESGSGYKVPDTTRYHHALVGARPQKSRAEAWRSSLSSREIELFESVTHGMLPMLGYARVHGRPRGPSRVEWLESKLRAFGARLLHHSPV